MNGCTPTAIRGAAKELSERLDVALSVLTDPWKERVEKPELRKEFEQITIG